MSFDKCSSRVSSCSAGLVPPWREPLPNDGNRYPKFYSNIIPPDAILVSAFAIRAIEYICLLIAEMRQRTSNLQGVICLIKGWDRGGDMKNPIHTCFFLGVFARL